MDLGTSLISRYFSIEVRSILLRNYLNTNLDSCVRKISFRDNGETSLGQLELLDRNYPPTVRDEGAHNAADYVRTERTNERTNEQTNERKKKSVAVFFYISSSEILRRRNLDRFQAELIYARLYAPYRRSCRVRGWKLKIRKVRKP